MKKNLNIIDFLAQIPWWVSVTLSVSFYVFLKFIMPYIEAQSSLVDEVHVSLGPVFAPVVALALLAPVTFSFLKSNRRKKLHDLKERIETIQEMPWEEFKELVAEAYRRQGYIVLTNSPYTSDTSVDLVLRKGANIYLVQCRYWLNRKLGIREVKNHLTLMTTKQANSIFLLTTGIFSNEARHFGATKQIHLVDGIELVELLDTVSDFSPSGASN